MFAEAEETSLLKKREGSTDDLPQHAHMGREKE
jgi:hypothetical protein